MAHEISINTHNIAKNWSLSFCIIVLVTPNLKREHTKTHSRSYAMYVSVKHASRIFFQVHLSAFAHSQGMGTENWS